MNRLFIVDEAIDKMGGVERIINTLANDLSKYTEVNVISLYRTRDKEFFNYKKNINITYIYDARNKIIFNNKKNKILRKICMLLSNIKIFIKLKKMNKIIKKNDRIIIARVRVAWKYVDMFKRSDYVYVRDAIHLFNCKFYEKFFMKLKFPKYVKIFIVSSDESLKTYDNFFNNKLKMEKIYNPLSIKPKNVYNPENKVIMAIGRDDFQKGYNVLIDSFQIINKSSKDWKLEIVGFTNNINLIKKIKSLGLQNSITLSPPTHDVIKKLSTAGIFVMTSRYEGYANALVESLSCGIPSVSFNWYMGVDEIIKSQDNGIIVRLKNRKDYFEGKDSDYNSRKLASSIIELIKDTRKRMSISKKAHEIIETRNEKVILKKWIQILELDKEVEYER